MLNIGTNPTFSEEARTIEVHIFEFNEAIYDSILTIEFHSHIRGEIKFESGTKLAEQIEKDKSTALELLSGCGD